MTNFEDSIRTMRKQDLTRVLAWRNHPNVRKFMYTQHEIDFSEHEKWFHECQQDSRKLLLIFEVKQMPMGFVNLNIGDGKVAHWGFYTAPEANKGTGWRLAKTALNHAFDKVELHKICGEALAFNEPSIKFHQKLGFKREGTLREQHFDGTAYHDVLCFGLLRSEWNNNKRSLNR